MGLITKFNFKKFFTVNTAVLIAAYAGIKYYDDRVCQKIYKETVVFKEAMHKLKSHRGVTYLMGDILEDGKVRILQEEKVDNGTMYCAQVPVRGSKKNGNVKFWLIQKDEQSGTELTRIELKLHDMNKRLLVFHKDDLSEQ